MFAAEKSKSGSEPAKKKKNKVKSTDLPVGHQLFMELVEKDLQDMFEMEVCFLGIFSIIEDDWLFVLGQDDHERQAGARESRSEERGRGICLRHEREASQQI